MLKERRKWAPPQVLALGALPEGLGNCVSGSTETGTTCQNGQATPATATHDCIVGGATKGKCTTGGGGTT